MVHFMTMFTVKQTIAHILDTLMLQLVINSFFINFHSYLKLSLNEINLIQK